MSHLWVPFIPKSNWISNNTLLQNTCVYILYNNTDYNNNNMKNNNVYLAVSKILMYCHHVSIMFLSSFSYLSVSLYTLISLI